MAAKLVVTASKGGSRISLVGTSGTELLGSKIFDEPRAKGATLRSLKSLLGEDIVVEDYTLSDGRASRLAKASNTPTAAPEPAVDTVAAEAPKPQPRRASKAGNSAKSSRKGPVKSAAKSPATAPSKTAPKVTAKAVGRARKQAAK